MINKNSHFHFMGIGGIGMSGLAKILKSEGYIVSGCDLDHENKTVKELKAVGCKISNEHNSAICQDKSINTLVYSTAVQQNNPEILLAKEKAISIIHRADLLAELMKQKYCIAVAGSHGKTTTSSMISHILVEAKKDPTVIIGGYSKNLENNAIVGKSTIMVAEADESDRSIEKLFPTYAIVTNIDFEHLETYKNIEDIKNTFIKFINKVPFYAKAIVCIDDHEVRNIIPSLSCKFISYAIDQKADITAKNIGLLPDYSTYDLYKSENFLTKIYLNIAGKHNILNSLAAITFCIELDIPIEIICEALKTFKGTERRFSYNGMYKEAEIFDDYGHHPNEIISTLKVAQKKTKKKLNIVFQPHRFTRTQKLWTDFVETFANNQFDNLIITDIYPASEMPIYNINSLNLVNDIKKRNPKINVIYIPLDKDFKQIINEINNILEPKDLLLLLGAGSVNKIANKLLNNN